MSFQTVYLCQQHLVLHRELLGDGALVDAVQEHLSLLMAQLNALVVELNVLVEKGIEHLLKRCAADLMARPVDGHTDVTFLYDQGHVSVTDGKHGEARSVETPYKPKATMYYFAGVNVLHLVVHQSFQIELAAVEHRYRR